MSRMGLARCTGCPHAGEVWLLGVDGAASEFSRIQLQIVKGRSGLIRKGGGQRSSTALRSPDRRRDLA